MEKWDNSRSAFRQSPASHLPQQLRQLGEVGGDAARLVAGQQLGRRTSARLLLEVDIGERVAAVILDDEAGGVGFFNVSRW